MCEDELKQIKTLKRKLALAQQALKQTNTITKKYNETLSLLKEKEHFTSTVIESNKNAIIAIDNNHTVIIFNKSAEDMFGYSKDEMVGFDSLYKIIPDEVLKAHKDAIKKFLMQDLKKVIIPEYKELFAKTKDNKKIPIRIGFGIEKEKDKTIIVANIEDISKEIEAKNKLIELNVSLEKRVQDAIELTKKQSEELQRHTRLVQMGEMLSMIAHQWRQPLGAINSAIMSIDNKLKLNKFDLSNETQRDKFLNLLEQKHSHILNYVNNLSQTIDDFRNFFKPNKQKECVELTQPILNALDIVQASMKAKGIKIELDFKNNDKIDIYKNELIHVILNILKNAQDNFLERKISNAVIKISTYKKDFDYFIEIEDNGGGIDEEILPKIFDPYFSTKDEKNGTGLGLYMSKTIIEEHHKGILNAKNSENGVIFTIKLIGC